IDLPLDHRSAWGTIVGGGERATGNNLSVLDADAAVAGTRIPSVPTDTFFKSPSPDYRRQGVVGNLARLLAGVACEIAGGTDGLWTLRWREPDSNHRSRSYDKHPNWLEKEPELCPQGQPRCARRRERLGRSRYPDNRMVRRGPSSCPNALPKPCAPRVRLVGRTLCSIALLMSYSPEPCPMR